MRRPVLCSDRPCANGRALARAPCSDLGERGSRGRVDDAIAKPKPPMLLALPALMTASPSKFWVLGSWSDPWSDLATLVYSLMREWTLGFVVYASGGSSRLKETSDVALPLWAIHHAWKSEQAWPLCDADWEKEGVEVVSMTPSPSQNHPCFLPCPALMTASPSKS